LIQSTRWTSARREGDQIVATLSDGRRLQSQDLLFAAGRTGNTSELGLDKVGVVPDARGYLAVDAEFRTTAPHIFAAGDVVGFPALASVSMEQGRVAVCHAFEFNYKRAVSKLMPYGIYTIPEVSAFGETEETCKQKAIDYVVGRALFANNPRGKIAGDLDGLIKLVVERKSRKLLGVHVVGERATELVHVGQCAIHLNGGIDVFIDMVFNYPTLADSYKYAAYECLKALESRAISAN
jgi:NAD(P) transhydrogenase